MKILKVKSILFSLLAVMAVAVFMTSCEQTDILSTELHEVSDNLIDLPHDIENQIIEDSNLIEDRASCKCKHMGASSGYPNSSYIYCHGNNGQSKGFTLRKAGNKRIVETGTTSGYYVHCTNLEIGTTYQYRVIMNCAGGGQSVSPWVSFTQ